MSRLLRRAAYALRFPAALVLPLWVLIGYAVFGGGVAGLVGVVLLVPLIVAAELVLSLLFSARADARRTRMLAARDAAVLLAFQIAVVGFGFFGPAAAWFGVVAAAAALVGIWLGTRRLAEDVRLQAGRVFGTVGPRSAERRAPIDAGEYVVVKSPKG